MTRIDAASVLLPAPVDRVFAALVEEQALLAWLPPRGMTGSFERFDLRPGGGYRLRLTYAAPAAGAGKTSVDADVVDVRIVDVVPGESVVQEVEFESEDAAYAGTMTMTWRVSASGAGTLVEIIAEGVPDGISAQDHAEGFASSLENLAAHLASSS